MHDPHKKKEVVTKNVQYYLPECFLTAIHKSLHVDEEVPINLKSFKV